MALTYTGTRPYYFIVTYRLKDEENNIIVTAKSKFIDGFWVDLERELFVGDVQSCKKDLFFIGPSNITCVERRLNEKRKEC